jgi:hypothetical protein
MPKLCYTVAMTHASDLPASSTFEAFLQQGLDRCLFISSWLRAKDIPHTVVELSGKRHIVVRFDSASYDPRFRMKTLVAHYDRAPDTPGANDNSAACFQLMLFAEKLVSRNHKPADLPVAHNIRIFFTDGEEAAGTKGISGQGAFALGSGMRRLKMTDDDVYVFDACGRGDTLILSTAGFTADGKKESSLRPSRLTLILENLHKRSAELARSAAGENWIRLPTPYSDNAGFIASGIAAQVYTVLPNDEAAGLLRALSGTDLSSKELLAAVTANKALSADSPLAPLIPETWRFMHTKKDSASTLTAPAFALISALLDAIARHMEIA